ncbi:hypothetical protein OKA05_11670 [Luteolibacter arcticus]|uniref:Uncharacterized protein n=1 Tax=Luteolibacter arcticus TaxID=1581411 RepID=A0ABT3GI67_9BACT|nr:hypothetical protein [Luteolibacter arcticus]MCW1923213.1 hypothetical protein [Luteolibacter arcticus]
MREAPKADAAPVNQLSISGNACGPSALLSSFRCGNDAWQRAASSLPGTTDREQLGQWIRRHGLLPSETLRGRKRWTSAGINVEDLVAATNEMTKPLYLPAVSQDDLFLRRGEKREALLRRTHQRLEESLSKGIPPLLSLRRFVLRDGKWIALQGHFVTVTAVTRKLGRGESSFSFVYLDPWGGKRGQGTLRVPTTSLVASPGLTSPCLEAIVPAANIGKKEVRRAETTAVVPAAVVGRW